MPACGLLAHQLLLAALFGGGQGDQLGLLALRFLGEGGEFFLTIPQGADRLGAGTGDVAEIGQVVVAGMPRFDIEEAGPRRLL
jgi:hypothetical protein